MRDRPAGAARGAAFARVAPGSDAHAAGARSGQPPERAVPVGTMTDRSGRVVGIVKLVPDIDWEGMAEGFR